MPSHIEPGRADLASRAVRSSGSLSLQTLSLYQQIASTQLPGTAAVACTSSSSSSSDRFIGLPATRYRAEELTNRGRILVQVARDCFNDPSTGYTCNTLISDNSTSSFKRSVLQRAPKAWGCPTPIQKRRQDRCQFPTSPSRPSPSHQRRNAPDLVSNWV